MTTETAELSHSSGFQASAAKSHHGRHHSRNKKGSDPFLQVSDDATKLSEPSTKHTISGENGGGQPPSLLADLVLTPINMITFILSLSYIDYGQRQWRLSQRPPSAHETFWLRLTSWSWLDPEPYQDPGNTAWTHDGSSAAQNRSDNSFHGWYTRKKHRAMAKMELSDAFEMRGRVLLAIIAWMLLVVFGVAYSMKRVYAWMSVY
ncbi:hypothetical protein NU219Hw_g6739t1 [Hortaea werneckii]